MDTFDQLLKISTHDFFVSTTVLTSYRYIHFPVPQKMAEFRSGCTNFEISHVHIQTLIFKSYIL